MKPDFVFAVFDADGKQLHKGGEHAVNVLAVEGGRDSNIADGLVADAYLAGLVAIDVGHNIGQWNVDVNQLVRCMSKAVPRTVTRSSPEVTVKGLLASFATWKNASPRPISTILASGSMRIFTAVSASSTMRLPSSSSIVRLSPIIVR